MQTQTARRQAWPADLAKIQAEIDRHGCPRHRDGLASGPASSSRYGTSERRRRGAAAPLSSCFGGAYMTALSPTAL